MRFKMIACLILITVTTGCAHKISIVPDKPVLNQSSMENASESVGYYLPSDARDKVVITPGGGGDRVQYKPYNDIEAGFKEMLSNIFKDVIPLTSDSDPAINKNKLNYVIALDISTNSSSPSMFTWPPTWFGVDLTSRISDGKGKHLTTILVKGEGKTEFSDFLGDKGIAGKIASSDALIKMQKALFDFKQHEKTGVSTKTSSPSLKGSDGSNQADAFKRLKNLQKIYDSGLITKEEFESKRLKIINGL